MLTRGGKERKEKGKMTMWGVKHILRNRKDQLPSSMMRDAVKCVGENVSSEF